MQKIAFVFGTRPEAIKLAPLINLFKNDPDIRSEVCTTGQHREMLNQVLEVFNITPDVSLDLMTHNQSLQEFFSRSIVAIDKYIIESNPDFIAVQGDTSTVLAASMAAFYNKKKILHIEAGLRTNNLYSPYPEEMNRRLTSQLSYFHFAPTPQAKNNLLLEGVLGSKIAVTGNTAIDALLQVKQSIEKGEIIPDISLDLLNNLERYKRMILITGHRRENFGEGFINICRAIQESAQRHKDCLFLYPVHLNPNVKMVVFDLLKGIDNVKLIEPQPYVEFIYLMMRSDIILTDSGGVQEEGPSLKKPILVMRENTERPEGVEAGCSVLVGTDVEKINSHVSRLLNDESYYQSFATHENPYGNGTAAQKILHAMHDLMNHTRIDVSL